MMLDQFRYFDIFSYEQKREDRLIPFKYMGMPINQRKETIERESQMNRKIHVWFGKRYDSCEMNGKIIYFH